MCLSVFTLAHDGDQVHQHRKTLLRELSKDPVQRELIRTLKSIFSGEYRVHQVIPGLYHGISEDLLPVSGNSLGVKGEQHFRSRFHRLISNIGLSILRLIDGFLILTAACGKIKQPVEETTEYSSPFSYAPEVTDPYETPIIPVQPVNPTEAGKSTTAKSANGKTEKQTDTPLQPQKPEQTGSTVTSGTDAARNETTKSGTQNDTTKNGTTKPAQATTAPATAKPAEGTTAPTTGKQPPQTLPTTPPDVTTDQYETPII